MTLVRAEIETVRDLISINYMKIRVKSRIKFTFIIVSKPVSFLQLQILMGNRHQIMPVGIRTPMLTAISQ